ncbi:MAG: hypothetical protein U0324_08705 [Polyangiales bacterium]
MREFLARTKLEPEYRDVRKQPVDAESAVALVRRHKRAFAKKGVALRTLDPAGATDAEIRALFLGREGSLRAPTLSVGDAIVGGWDEALIEKLLAEK